VDSPNGAKARTGKGTTRRLQGALADRRRHAGRGYPAGCHRRVVLLIDNAPWGAGDPVRAALADQPPPERERSPSDSPQVNPVERFGRVLRRRATPNRLFDSLADLRRSLRSGLSYFRTMRGRVRPLVNRQPRKRTPSAGL
jgi:transposase-like protein